ncbi:hypothetical protein NEIELOOT_00882 [Neisseria elongata subsp. glycolytica ATCC 29315]|uniref:Uncharacterized protein n=1 Tax=Neisseria elongata subsp. glycolytica ATCC 29315 TaxID=546263 RepID=D4DP98_NEIEG|nr:hypothetical protein NEIELOOT_00882 [Neisseria elongata subsp. glycolytica ATCC 29315]
MREAGRESRKKSWTAPIGSMKRVMSFRKIEGESTVKPYGIHQI